MSGSTRFLQSAGLVATLGTASFVVTIFVLTWAEPQSHPHDHFVSDLAHTPLGGFMTGAFVLAGLGLLALAVGLFRALGPNSMGWGATVVLAIGGVCLMGLALFPVDPADQVRDTWEGQVHTTLAGIAFVAVAASSVTYGFAFRDDARWRSYWGRGQVLALASVAGMLAFAVLLWICFTSHNYSLRLLAWGERAAIAPGAAWVMGTAFELRRLGRKSRRRRLAVVADGASPRRVLVRSVVAEPPPLRKRRVRH